MPALPPVEVDAAFSTSSVWLDLVSVSYISDIECKEFSKLHWKDVML
jgi:hypothetical protein